VTLLAGSTLATTLLMVRFMFLLWTRRRREIVPLPGVPLSAWLCLVALILVLPFLLADSDRLMINAGPVSVGLALGLVTILVVNRISPYFISRHKCTRTQELSSPTGPTLRHALQTARIKGQSRVTSRAHAVAAFQRQAGEWLARLQHHTESARRPLTGALWLGIAGGLLAAFAAAT